MNGPLDAAAPEPRILVLNLRFQIRFLLNAMGSEWQPCLAFRGTLVDCPAFGEVRVRRDTLCIVDPTVGGRIVGLWPGSAEAEVLQAHQLDARHVIRLQVGEAGWSC